MHRVYDRVAEAIDIEIIHIADTVGQALAEAWGDRTGVERFGDALVPIDEALTQVAIDLSGRPYLVYEVDAPVELIGTFETSLVKHFFEAVIANARITLHVRGLAGDNTHHVYESLFKGVAVALRRAVEVTGVGLSVDMGHAGGGLAEGAEIGLAIDASRARVLAS